MSLTAPHKFSHFNSVHQHRAREAIIGMMLAKPPSNFEAGIIGAMAAISALLVLRARRQVCDWSPSAPFHWERKRAAMADLTANDVMVITDFDATITTGDSEQCHDMVGSSRLLSDEFRKEFAPLLDWTTNANIDGVPWWDAAVRPTAPRRVHRLALALAFRARALPQPHAAPARAAPALGALSTRPPSSLCPQHEMMVKHRTPPRALIPRLVRDARMVPRPGALELLKALETAGIPVLIVSAGLSDVIEEFLRQHGALSENLAICSNRLNYDADAAPKSVSPDPPITSFTKEYAYSSASSFFAEHKHRRAIIQLGDSLSDVDPAKKVPYDQLISIGFLNAKLDARKHGEAFDAVVCGNLGSVQPVSDLIEDILSDKESESAVHAFKRALSRGSIMGSFGARTRRG